ncbi:MAG: 16S rRNA (guanine(527)-N(7))-methyltransferase RsmG [Spirochaetes bacterium]|nr:16S rRNA (guanine(527)-N(7))-methyltransferase RsmG [Spirochaetota bacterium]
MSDLSSLLKRGLNSLSAEGGAPVLEKLLKYVSEIETWNPAYSLVAASGEDLVVKHILDSLAPWRLLAALAGEFDAGSSTGPAVVSDLGTGAGLPGIPLSILMPGRKFRLVERMGKRISFLESQKLILSLDNVEIVESEVERAPGPFDIVVFRAFRPFAELKLFKLIWKNLSPGGAILAYKGKLLNAKRELDALDADPLLSEPAASAEVRGFCVPFLEEERCAVVMRKARLGLIPS